MEINIGIREFFHMLLKKHARELKLKWPEDYPERGGWRGGRKAVLDPDEG